MHTDVTEAGPFERLLTMRLDEAELEPAKNDAARKLSHSLKIKGFRPGKAPRAVVERMVGPAALRSEAIDDALGGFVSDAIGKTELRPVTAPRVEDVRDGDDGGVEVEVRVTLWPTVEFVPDFSDRKIFVEAPEVSDEELDAQIDRLRGQFAELEDVDREADDGDFVMINLSAESAAGPVDEASATDLLYEVGSHSFITGLDEVVLGSSAGDIREGPATLPEGFGEHADVTLRVLVKGVRAKKLPEVTDEWVSDVTEFDTVDELRDQLERSVLAMKMGAVQSEFRERVVGDLADEMDLELPDALVEAEMEASLHNLAHGLDEQGISLADYLRITGQDQDAFLGELRARATRALRTRILLESVAETEGVVVGQDEIDAAIDEMAARTEQDTAAVRSALAEGGQEEVLTGDILRRKALDKLLDEATPVDAEGNIVDLDVATEEGEGAGEVSEESEPSSDNEPAARTDEGSGPDADIFDDAG